MPFKKSWNGFTRHIDKETGYWLYRYVKYGGGPLTVVLHIGGGTVRSIGIYRGKVDVPKITPPGDPAFKKGQLPLPVVPSKPSVAPKQSKPPKGSGPSVSTNTVIAADTYPDLNEWKARPAWLYNGNGEKNGINDIVWSSWGGSEAKGRGSVIEKTCEPSCAESPEKVVPVKVTAFRKRRCNGLAAYTRVRISTLDGKDSWVNKRLCPGDR